LCADFFYLYFLNKHSTIMARLTYQDDFPSQFTSFKKMKAKHDLDAAASKIIPWLTEHAVDLADDLTDGTAAEAQHNLHVSLDMAGEKLLQARDIRFNPIYSDTKEKPGFKQCVQYVKTLVKPAVDKLADWKIPVDNGGRINYPSDFPAQAQLVLDFFNVHLSFPAGTSKLQPFIDERAIDVAAIVAAVPLAVADHTAGTQKHKDAETATQQRDVLWNPVWKHYTDIGQFLMNLFVGKEKKCGDWGYTVDDSQRPPKIQISNFKPLETKTIKSIVIGSTGQNIGESPIHVYQGKTTKGTPRIFRPNEFIPFGKGDSTSTFVNPDPLLQGKIKVLRNR